MINRNPNHESGLDQPASAEGKVSPHNTFSNGVLARLVNALEKHIPLGWEDSKGFHFGAEPVPAWAQS